MSEKPILFTGAMVNAIRDGRKTMTRRVVKPGLIDAAVTMGEADYPPANPEYYEQLCPYGAVGDRLWVRETFAVGYGKTWYRADDDLTDSGMKVKWKPSIFMPLKLSRITLEITSVKVERVQDISEEDAIAEGVGHGFQCNAGWPDYCSIINGICTLTQDSARMSFASLWDSINAKRGYSWASNPWTWAIAFKQVPQ